MRDLREVMLVKLGGSLITDKTKPRTARPEVIAQLADQLRRARQELEIPVIVGHGSGSFGHVAAAAAGIHRGLTDPEQLAGVSTTQGQAFALHRLVVTAMRDAGVPTYSVLPSSCMMARGGRPDRLWPDPLLAALRLGLTPVVCGDVVMDSEQGVSICSTESVFLALVPALGSRGLFVRRVIWLGETAGVLDDAGVALPAIALERMDEVLASLRGAAGIDVTGGMRHRLETAAALARQGVASWIGDGTRAESLLEGLADTAQHGTRIVPGA